MLYSPCGRKKPGPKGPSKEVIGAIVEMKRRNPRYGCPRIAQQINLAFGLDLDKDTVRRVLFTHCKPVPGKHGPSWLTALGHAKDSLWSIDLFRCESILLKSHWVMVVMDQYTRSIIGFAVHAGNVDGPTLCRMFNNVTSGPRWPERVSTAVCQSSCRLHLCGDNYFDKRRNPSISDRPFWRPKLMGCKKWGNLLC